MKYLVEITVTPEAGKSVESLPGGPGPLIERLIQRFRPETTFMAISRRVVYMLVDLDDSAMAELMIAGTEIAGEYPTFTAVVSMAEFPKLIGKAVSGAKKIIEG